MYGCVNVYVCIYMYVGFLLFICIKRKCVLKRIYKVVCYHMYVINILVCVTYNNFQYYNAWMCVENNA